MQDGEATPERIDLHLIFRGALETDALSLEHDTLVVSFELKRRVAEDVRAALEAAEAAARGSGNAPANPA